MLEKSSQFLSSDQPSEPKSLDVALDIAGVEKYARKTCNCGQPGGHSIPVLNEGALVTVEIRVLCGRCSQISLKWCRRHLLASTQLAVSCCAVNWTGTFASESCCAVNWTGPFASESKVMCLSDFKK